MKKVLIGLLILLAIPILITALAFLYHMTPLFRPTSALADSYSDLASKVRRSCVLPAEELLPTEYEYQMLSVNYNSILKINVTGYRIHHDIGMVARSVTCEIPQNFEEEYAARKFDETYRDIQLDIGKPAGSVRDDRHFYSFYLGEYSYSVHAETKAKACEIAYNIIDRYLDGK
jgi:hypothetical protein